MIKQYENLINNTDSKKLPCRLNCKMAGVVVFNIQKHRRLKEMQIW